MYGIPEDLFWHLNPTMMKPWREAYDENNRANDVLAWNIGRYVMEAIASCFGDHTYTDKPYSLKENVEQQGLTDKEKFEMWAMQFNSQRNNNNNDKG